ncbi:MAG TPA: hypothetical protein PKC30_15470, partial [Saprospiraceae bacterium]|nr:hypothetical protein [Saprospiraceae bacterium]
SLNWIVRKEKEPGLSFNYLLPESQIYWLYGVFGGDKCQNITALELSVSSRKMMFGRLFMYLFCHGLQILSALLRNDLYDLYIKNIDKKCCRKNTVGSGLCWTALCGLMRLQSLRD